MAGTARHLLLVCLASTGVVYRFALVFKKGSGSGSGGCGSRLPVSMSQPNANASIP